MWNRIKLTFYSFMVLGILLPFGWSDTKKIKKIYFVGNSITDTVKYGLFAQMAKEKSGWEIQWGRHIIPGAPLFIMLETAEQGKQAGFTEKPYGDVKQALEQFVWDVLVLQPFDRRLHTSIEKHDEKTKERGIWESDNPTIQRYLDKFFSKSPEGNVYIYARWPRAYINGRGVSYNKDDYDQNVRGITPTGQGVPKVTLDDFQKIWSTPYTGGWGPQLEGKDFFEKLTQKIRESYPQKSGQIFIIPVGHVMAELDKQMKEGTIPGGGVYQSLYADSIHLNNKGSYLVAATFYSVIFRDQPDGLDAKLYEVHDESFVKQVNTTIWKVVTQHPLTGLESQEKRSY